MPYAETYKTASTNCLRPHKIKVPIGFRPFAVVFLHYKQALINNGINISSFRNLKVEYSSKYTHRLNQETF